MRWREYGAMFLLKHRLEQEHYMLDDLVFAFLQQKGTPASFEEICQHIHTKTDIDIEDVRENLDFVVDSMVKGKSIKQSEQGYYAEKDVPIYRSPLHDNIGTVPK